MGHGDPGRSGLSSAGALRRQCVSGGIGRGHLLRAAGLHRSDAVNAYVGGVAGLPGESRGLTLLNRIGISGQRSRWRCRWWWRRWRRWWGFLVAGAQEQHSAQRENKRNPLQSLLLHFSSLRLSRTVARIESEPAERSRRPSVPLQKTALEQKILYYLIYYFQLQFGCVLLPVVVNCFCWLPSASMVQICSPPERLD